MLAFIVAVMVSFALPFDPDVRIEDFRYVAHSDRYEQAPSYRVDLRNESFTSIYYCGGSGYIHNFSYSQSGNDGVENKFSSWIEPPRWTKLRPGEVAVLEIPLHGDYDSVRVSTEVSDWRGRLSSVVSETLTFAEDNGLASRASKDGLHD